MNGVQGERLMRIETLLEEALMPALDEVRRDIKAIRADLDSDKADLAALKNKGAGILIGVTIAAGSVSALVTHFWSWLRGLFA